MNHASLGLPLSRYILFHLLSVELNKMLSIVESEKKC